VKLVAANLVRPRRGETRSGDAALVRSAEDTDLLAVIDALGHGPRAADVADRAISFLAAAPLKDGVKAIIEDLHRQLAGTRGAAATLCLLREGELEAAGVGNVVLRGFGMRLSVLSSAGVLGARLRELRVFRARLQPQTRLLFYSDGVKGDVGHEAQRGTPAEACAAILRRHGTRDDDATILIADIS
jgi:negative regulator of sigma-B (phosphoserine phosphatase)